MRWSDRREDFRTEVLGLAKAQQVKNAVIVPSGAKGGFVLKSLPPSGSRDDVLQAGIAAYEEFISGLLDITDNLKGEVVKRPKRTVRYDDDDPYLVVAADKGTATFSDIANRIAEEYDYWLGDAFASGGQTGYDHKKMGITARGGWVSVQRHFQEMGVNPQKNDFTVLGIGDMSGDVFGNGMLLSKHIKLVAAFNHMHIFIDPDPDLIRSFSERKRLFEKPRSMWKDYNPELISKGGGVYERSAKSIKLTAPVKALLKVRKDSMPPNELIRALLKMPVDLLWNGGIGTYVKASWEEHGDVGDRTNDVVRVDGNEVRAKVIVEGGNLGLTQLGRVEYALNGGRINTDFIDNSGGVDCSDCEVNTKILLNNIVKDGDLTEKQRNQLLAKMTDDVARLVLRDNYRQNRAISLAMVRMKEDFNLFTHFLESLERQGQLNRELEFLPTDKELLRRKAGGIGFMRPEVSILLSYSKILLKDEILASNLPEDTYLSAHIALSFPTPLRKRFQKQMSHHRLSREIIATQLSNDLVTDMGFAFVYQMQDESGAQTAEIVKAYVIAREVFNMPVLWSAIRALDYQVPVETQVTMMLELTRVIRRATRWFLRNPHRREDINATVQHFSEHMRNLSEMLPKVLVGSEKTYLSDNMELLVAAGVSHSLAHQLTCLRILRSALNIIEATMQHKAALADVAGIYFNLIDKLDLIWFREQINAYPVDNHWAVLARSAVKGELDVIKQGLTVTVLTMKSQVKGVEARIDAWCQTYQELIARWQTMLTELKSTEVHEYTMLSVAMRELFALAGINR